MNAPGAKLGELNARVLNNQVVLTYTDYSIGNAVSQTAPAPDAPWSAPKPQITGIQAPMQYAPCIHPWSSIDDTHFALSQWITPDVNAPFVMYGVRQWHGSSRPGIFPFGSSKALADTGVTQFAKQTDEGHAVDLPIGPARGVLDGIAETDKASVPSDLSEGTVSAAEMRECLDLAQAGKIAPPRPSQLIEASLKKREE